VIEVGAEPAPFVYPLAAAFQEQDKSFRVRILRSGFDGALEVERFYEEDGEYRRFLSVAATESGSPRCGARLARPQSAATCYAFTTPAGLGVLNLPPEEFFPLPASPRSPPPRRRAFSTSFCCLFRMA